MVQLRLAGIKICFSGLLKQDIDARWISLYSNAHPVLKESLMDTFRITAIVVGIIVMALAVYMAIWT